METAPKPTPCHSGFRCGGKSGNIRGVGRNHPKWRMFGSEVDERSFVVRAMTWWERSGGDGGGEDFTSEDLLVAIIEYVDGEVEGGERGCYLVCWSRRR